ncbi:MAG: phosphatidylglycerophosphatase A [Alphaproteobacteria bacterium]|nr:MAG: phosphatidylglycerophosphatase A [Alphaproteobacteria bacterium]
MIKLYDLTATFFYSGYMKPASGTWGSFAALPVCLLTVHYGGIFGIILGSLVLFCIGLWAANAYERATGEHDSSHIVIDEAAGLMLACIPLLYDFSWGMIGACFILFRLFDAVKKGPVGWCDTHVSGAFGVMIDDIVAGLMTVILILGYLLWIQ